MAHEAKGLIARPISAYAAALALSGLEGLDPSGLMVADDIPRMTKSGQCFEVVGEAANAVYVLTVRNGVVWVDAVKGEGDLDVTALLDGVITAQAQGLEAIGLQTARRGLVKKLQRHGYRVTGWVMRKDLQ